MTVRSFTFNPFATNCYICHSAGEAVLVDAAGHNEREHRAVEDYLAENNLQVRHLLLTHGHIDHIFGCAYFAEKYGMDWQMHRDDLPMLERSEEQSAAFGVPLRTPPVPDGNFLTEGDTIRFGDATWEVLYTPGHSPGSVSFYDHAADVVMSGDVLFQGSVGRVDLPGGSMPVLMENIFQKLIPLGDKTRVYSGHGPETTIGRERTSNPFLTER